MAYQSIDLQNSVDNYEVHSPSLIARAKKYRKPAAVFVLMCLGAVLWYSSTPASETFNLSVRERKKVIDVTDTSICKEPTYSQTTLKTAEESSMISLFFDPQNNYKFEASDVAVVGNAYYVVYDNLYAIGRISKDLPFRSHRNVLLGNHSGESGYEAIVHDALSNRFFVVVEAVKHADHKFHAVVEEVEMIDHTDEQVTLQTKAAVSFKPIESCPCELEFARENKGFEGATLIRIDEDNLFLLGLCEGNFCEGGRKGEEAGNGRIVVMQKIPAQKGQGCYWKTVRVMELPKSVNFVDYSAMSVYPSKKPGIWRFAVSSQQSAAVWIGELDVSHKPAVKNWQFSRGKIFDFPRDNDCRVVYCNVEGVAFVSDDMLVAVSDQMKVDNRQPFQCLQKDQSIHVFVIPQPEPSSKSYDILSRD